MAGGSGVMLDSSPSGLIDRVRLHKRRVTFLVEWRDGDPEATATSWCSEISCTVK